MAKDKKTKSKSKSNSKNTSKKQAKKQTEVKVTKKPSSSRILRKAKPKPSHIDLTKEGKDFNAVARVGYTDIPGYMPISKGVVLIYGIDKRLGEVIEKYFSKKINKTVDKIGYLTEKEIEQLNEFILNLDKELPKWMLNRAHPKDNSKHFVMADLKLENRKDLQRLGKLKTYRGLRLQWGLPVRGQKTKSTFRKSGVVGVSKKK